MKRGLQGRLEPLGTGLEGVEAFVPNPLPPRPPLQLGGDLPLLLEGASRALGTVAGTASRLEDAGLHAHLLLRKEALLSARIEGRLASLPELLLFESGAAPGIPYGDVREVARLVTAYERGFERLDAAGSLTLALLQELHGVLAGGGSGDVERRRAFRALDATVPATHSEAEPYIPPPGTRVIELMEAFEEFLRQSRHGGGRPSADDGTPTLVRAALAHAQLQMIHPFAGSGAGGVAGAAGGGGAAVNGVMSRLLVCLLLRAEGALPTPLLCASLHFKEEREAYRDRLERVRLEGDWEGWIAFFLTAVERGAAHAVGMVARVLALASSERERIRTVGRAAGSALQLHDRLLRTPLLTIPHAGRLLPLTAPTLGSAFRTLEELGIVEEVTGRARDRLFVHRNLLDILCEGTEPYGRREVLAGRGAESP